MFCCTCNTCMETDNYSEQSSGSMLWSDFGKREGERGGKMKAEINEVSGAFAWDHGAVQWRQTVEESYSSFVVCSR